MLSETAQRYNIFTIRTNTHRKYYAPESGGRRADAAERGPQTAPARPHLIPGASTGSLARSASLFRARIYNIVYAPRRRIVLPKAPDAGRHPLSGQRPASGLSYRGAAQVLRGVARISRRRRHTRPVQSSLEVDVHADAEHVVRTVVAVGTGGVEVLQAGTNLLQGAQLRGIEL